MFGRSKAAASARVDVLPRDALLRLLATLAVILAPHLPRLPLWASGLVVAVIGWRVAAVLRQWPLLPTWLRTLLAFGAFAGIYASFGRVTGQTAGVALITVMAALKLTELRARRDTMVMVFLMYFMLVTHFLFSQELWTAAYLLVCASLITAVLVEANHPGAPLPIRTSLRFGARFVAQALPLMVVIFILFPRIPGPLWGLPSDSGAARSGLSDSMSPGDISALTQSDEVAFRVRFDDPPPPMRERYWRGPVFGHFDGRKWDAGLRPPEAANPVAEFDGAAVRYEVVLEPNRTPWLFALDLPERGSLPADAELNADYQLVLSKGEVRERRLYRLASRTHYRLQATLPPRLREIFLRLPKNSNPRTQQWGRDLRAQGLDDAAIVKTALRRFRSDEYFYTLQPPGLGRNGIDEFLFDTKRGFCEHYAGSFTFLMRAAGIPARVVTGYQGGEKNSVGDYYIVRQSDAHAWSEVWLEGQGWVRIDPTAAVAPERVEQGLGTALAGFGENMPAFLDPSRRASFRFNLRARWDWLNAQWNYWVLGYGPDLQRDFLRRFGLEHQREMLLALTLIVSALLGVAGLVLLRRSTPRVTQDPALEAWMRLQKRLARAGLPSRPGEGPQDYARRVAAVRPDLAAPIAEAARRYVEARYTEDETPQRQRGLVEAVSRVRP